MTTTTLERTEGLSVLNQAMAAIKEKIEEKRGVFNIQMEVNDINTVQIRFLVFNISTVQHKMCSEFFVWVQHGTACVLNLYLPRTVKQLANANSVLGMSLFFSCFLSFHFNLMVKIFWCSFCRCPFLFTSCICCLIVCCF